VRSPHRQRRLLAIVLPAVLLLASLPARAADTLYLYNWNNYISDDTVQRFEAHCKCRLKQDYYSDNEEMLAKLEAGALKLEKEPVLMPRLARKIVEDLTPRAKNQGRSRGRAAGARCAEQSRSRAPKTPRSKRLPQACCLTIR